MKKKITWTEKMTHERLYSVWYGGNMVKIETDEYICYIDAVGDIRIEIDGETYRDKNNGGTIRQVLEEHNIYTDEDLRKANVIWLNNNWFEFSVYDKKHNEWYYNENGECDYLTPDDDFAWVDDWVKEMEAE